MNKPGSKMRHGCAVLAALTVCGGLTGAAAAQSDRVVLAAHRAIYDLELDDSKPSGTIGAARGRLAYDFGGDACDGYTLSFRQVTELTANEGGPRVIDARTTSFEDGDGSSYRFKTESTITGEQPDIVNGTARKADAGYEIKLTEPKAETHRETVPAMFPNEQMKAVIKAARAGETTLNVRVYDGANTGKEVYDTLSVIGRRIDGKATPAAEEALRRPEMESMARWPVSVSYFKVGSGETTPAYTVSFELYENGVTGAIRLDYGSFALRGKLTRLDLPPASACRK